MKKSYVILVLVVCLSTILGSTLYFFLRPNFTPIFHQTTFLVNGAEINDFAYQLQDVDVAELGSSKYDLIIIDYSSDGSEEGEYTTSDLQLMKEPEDKLLLSYMSIGEA